MGSFMMRVMMGRMIEQTLAQRDQLPSPAWREPSAGSIRTGCRSR